MDYIGNKCYPFCGHRRETEEVIFRNQTFTIYIFSASLEQPFYPCRMKSNDTYIFKVFFWWKYVNDSMEKLIDNENIWFSSLWEMVANNDRCKLV